MSRSKEISLQIENIIEGFKLGSLGAGSKKFVPTSSEEPQVKQHKPQASDPEDLGGLTDNTTPQKIPSTIPRKTWFTRNDVDSNTWVAGVKWTESRGTKFLLKANLFDDHTCEVSVSGGFKLTVSKGGVTSRPMAKNATFWGNNNFAVSSKDDAERVFIQLFKDIFTAGSFGYALATGKLGSGWKLRGTKAFEVYMWNSSRIRTSPHFNATSI